MKERRETSFHPIIKTCNYCAILKLKTKRISGHFLQAFHIEYLLGQAERPCLSLRAKYRQAHKE